MNYNLILQIIVIEKIILNRHCITYLKYIEKKNSYPDDLKKLAKQLKEDANKLYNKLINNKKNIVKEIFDFLGKQEIIPFSAENFVGAENRVHSERAPYRNKKDGNKKHSHYDSMIWESLYTIKN
ncbi:hypothetical protein [Brachyspira hyodysenteriae]|uniref:hypothetical protein n=1 Tax=Brachyspira hyodysenteriae TaxID=159 RepID=UPI0022CE0BDA|nr:hypothetical protein [Brachyspira hyodysenteriae]MCZ9889263.1 hypothetical protein [Brachyspira hyodysenteriae]